MSKINVLFIASECAPFVKTGGLSDVCGALPKYFDKEKYDVRVMLPKYAIIPEKFKSQMQFKFCFNIGFLFRDIYVGILELKLNDVTFYFVDNEYYFGGSWPYGEVKEDIEKFAFFSRACLSSLKMLDFKPDILHCHDWESALVPVYLNDYFQSDVFYHKIKTITTIHNLKFQGVYDIPTVQGKTGLSDYYFTDDKLKHFENADLLKGGLVYSDRITTVSNTYLNEIQTEFYGEGLDGLIRAKKDKTVGIVNGIDTTVYNPETDPHIAANFTAKSFLKARAKNKAALQEELGLKQDPDAFVIGIVSRLTDQKGFDLIQCVFEDILRMNVQIVVLGTGEFRYESYFRQQQEKHPDKVRAEIFYSEELSRRIYAGTDAFLMPSLFEPCGLSQLIALRYGSVPIVRETGGLRDTVQPYNEYEQTGNGFSFTNYNAHDMLHVIEYAERIFREDRKSFNGLIKRGLLCDNSWNASAKKYEAMYNELFDEKLAEEKEAQK